MAEALLCPGCGVESPETCESCQHDLLVEQSNFEAEQEMLREAIANGDA